MLNQKQIDSYRDKKISPQKLFIDGAWIDGSGDDFEIVSPINGKKFTSIKRATVSDMEMAIKAARMSFDNGSWSNMAPTQRKKVLHKLADLIERDALELTVLGVRDNGTEINMAINAEAGSAAGTFRYYAECIDKVYGEIAPTANDVLGLIYKEPVGVVGAIVPWNFPLMIGAWKIAPALAAGNSIVLKPAETASLSLLKLAELAAEAGVPDGVLNVVTGQGSVVGKAMGLSMEVDVLAFTGSGPTGRRLLEYSSQSNMKRCYLELGGKSPNIFFEDILEQDDSFFDKALEGFTMFALNQGEVCTCPSRALIQESIYDKFMDRALERVKAIKQGSPLDAATMLGAQASSEQMEKILSYIKLGKEEGAELLIGGNKTTHEGEHTGGYYIEPTVFKGNNKMRIFQEEIFGPVVSVTTFKDEAEALEIANDTLYGLGAGVWTRDGNTAFRMGKGIQAGRVWTNCYHAYPAHAAFGGYKSSGIGRETHKMMLDHYQQTKNLYVSYSETKLGFF